MNCITHHLPELESATSHVREALQAILHTILFIRSPGPVAPFDVHCESFRWAVRVACIRNAANAPHHHYYHCSYLTSLSSTTYTRIATGNDSSMFQQAPTSQYSTAGNRQHQQKSELDCKVDDSIETFLRSLAPIGPELMAGCLTLSFYERKAKNKLFGLVHQEEKVVWEQWVLRVVVNNTPRPMGGDEASVIERQRIQVRLSTW